MVHFKSFQPKCLETSVQSRIVWHLKQNENISAWMAKKYHIGKQTRTKNHPLIPLGLNFGPFRVILAKMFGIVSVVWNSLAIEARRKYGYSCPGYGCLLYKMLWNNVLDFKWVFEKKKSTMKNFCCEIVFWVLKKHF